MDDSEHVLEPVVAAESALHHEPSSSATAPGRTRGALREIVETLLLTALIFLGVRILVQNYKVEGFSMEPTLQDGQYLLINKIGERFQKPERGDIIVFSYPLDPSKSFVKRVIAIPGDTVEMHDGQVLVDGKVLNEPYIKAPSGGIYPRTIMPAHDYFVMGDNRNNSSDSRSWGPLPENDITGKAWVSYWPISTWGTIHGYRYA